MPPKKQSKYKPINCYKLKDVIKLSPKMNNPGYKNHKINLHFNALILGSTGSGKTNILLNLIALMSKTFNHLYIFSQKEEPLYTHLTNKLHPDVFTITYGYENFLKFDEDSYYGNSLIIFDDFVAIKDQSRINDHFIRGRKLSSSNTSKGGNYGCSSIYLSQGYFKTPHLIRLQCNLIFVVRVRSLVDLGRMLKEYSGEESKENLKNMYAYCCVNSDFGEFLLIDLNTTRDKIYRRNYDEYLNVLEF